MNADEHRALDDLLDHIYEHGTTGEGVTLLTEKLLDSKRADIDRQRAANARLVTQIADQLEEIERLNNFVNGMKGIANTQGEIIAEQNEEIERLQEQVQDRDGVIEVTLLRELRLREALAEADRSLERAAQLNPAVMAAHAAIRAALAGKK